MTSPNLAAPHVAAAQNQKEVTINDATDALDRAITEALAVDCGAGGTIAITTAEMRRNARFLLEGAPGAAFTFELPAVRRFAVVRNATGQTATVRNPTGSETVDLPPAAQALLYSTGANVTVVGAGPPLVEIVAELPAEPQEGVFYVIPQA